MFKEILAAIADLKSTVTNLFAKADRVSALEAELATTKATVAERDTKIAALGTEIDQAKATLTAKDGEIATLKSDLATEKQRAEAVIASQGLPANQLPGQSPEAAQETSPQSQVDGLRKKLASTQDPKERFTLSKQIRELLAKKG
jgi:chromosome segregation ATPase